MKKTATFIKDLDLYSVSSDQKLYMVNVPVVYDEDKPTDYIVVSACASAFDTGIPETYIFPSNKHGEIIDWSELEGSFRGSEDHDKALIDGGYTIIKVEAGEG